MNNYVKCHLTLPQTIYRSGGKGRKRKAKTQFVQVPLIRHLTGRKKAWDMQIINLFYTWS